MITSEDTEAAMIAVTEDLELFKGFYAFRRILWSVPWLLFLIPLFYFPGVSLLGTRLYAWVARNRGRFGCRAESCDIVSSAKDQPAKATPLDTKDEIR